MLSTNLRYHPSNLMELINAAPRSVRGVIVEEASRVLVGDGTRGLRRYPPYQYVTRRAAYGSTFKSIAQQRYVMGMISRGEITPGVPRRTGRFQRGWSIMYDGVKSRIINTESYAGYLVGDPGQARLNELGGWQRMGLIIATEERNMVTAGDKAAQDSLRAMGL